MTTDLLITNGDSKGEGGLTFFHDMEAQAAFPLSQTVSEYAVLPKTFSAASGFCCMRGHRKSLPSPVVRFAMG